MRNTDGKAGVQRGRRVWLPTQRHRQGIGGVFLAGAMLLGVCCMPGAQESRPGGEVFREGFDDPGLFQRGWYDGGKFLLSTTNPAGGRSSIEYRWLAGGTTSDTTQTVRRRFPPAEGVYLAFSIRLSPGWGWTGRDYHPHLIQFMTTENGAYDGPAATHLTLYVEPQAGRLRLAAQDIQNQNQPHGLTQGPLRGGFNGRFFDSAEVLFRDDRWHRVEAYFRLNQLDPRTQQARADGIVQGWFDGRPVINERNVVLRSPDFPRMKMNQLLIAPYFGPGLLPKPQTLWLDELVVGTKRPIAAEPGR